MSQERSPTPPAPRPTPNTERGLQPAKNPPPMPKVVPPKQERSSS